MEKLQWDKLLSEVRIRNNGTKGNGDNVRNEFEADYDRIVGSSSVRRLQDKAQVFPLQKNDIVRTRLTHSMEVSAIARSLGKKVGVKLEEQGIFSRLQTEQLMGMLQTAGLIHDLGNPPFGHYGETVIRQWYEEFIIDEKKKKDKYYKPSQEELDFLYFDGNVQNLRILTKLQTMNDQYGINFTCGTLATIIKYPYSSQTTKHSKNKFGYFKSEQHIMEFIWANTGLGEGVRHPATYLLEAADDIVYICDDIEDGVKKGYISWNEEYRKICEKFENKPEYKDLFRRLNSEEKQPDKNMTIRERILARVRLFRNYVQGFLINSAVECFFDNYEQIMCGEYGLNELLVREDKFISFLKDITRRCCFSSDEVLSLEVIGDRVIKELLTVFYKAIATSNSDIIENESRYEGKIFHMISDNYKYIAKFDYEKNRMGELKDLSQYDKMHLIVDFLSGMTDSYAVSLYRKLLGISLPE